MEDLLDLEKQILIFIDQNTWDEKQPKRIKSEKYNKMGQVKIRWINIRWESFGKGKAIQRFTESDVEFNSALNTLKAQKLITSRTKCQLFSGLTTTQKGHEFAKRIKWIPETKVIQEQKLEQEILHGLKVLEVEDRDFKSLLVWINPNYIRGSNLEAGVLLRKELNKLIEMGSIKKEKSPKNRIIYSLKS